jgi:hypothetical protein
VPSGSGTARTPLDGLVPFAVLPEDNGEAPDTKLPDRLVPCRLAVRDCLLERRSEAGGVAGLYQDRRSHEVRLRSRLSEGARQRLRERLLGQAETLGRPALLRHRQPLGRQRHQPQLLLPGLLRVGLCTPQHLRLCRPVAQRMQAGRGIHA